MSQLNINLEPPFLPETAPIVRFLRLHFEQGSPDAQAHFSAAWENSGVLRLKQPDKAWVFHVSGVLCCCVANMEAGRRFFSEALMIDPDYRDSRVALEMTLVDDPEWPSADAYLDVFGDGLEALIAAYMKRARAAFDRGDMIGADRVCQRVSALMNPEYSMLGNLEDCMAAARGMAETGELAGAIAKIVEKLHRYWRDHDHVYKESTEGGEDIPLHRQRTVLVAKLIGESRARPVKVYEIGCLNGFNLDAIRREAARMDAPEAWFGGLEPNASAIASGRRAYPGIEISEGFHSDMISGRVPVPERIDICLASLFFAVLPPDEVAATLNFLSERTRRLVICDDILNLNGDLTVIRAELWLMHNFRALLDAAGFEIEEVVLADLPKREGAGFIIAKNRS